MSLPRGLKVRAGLALAASQTLLVVAGVLADAPLVAGAGAAFSLVLVAAWWSREQVSLLYASAAGGAVTASAPLVQPIGLPARAAVGVGVLALVAFLEYGHLAHRAARLGDEMLDDETEAAMRGRLTRVLAWTSLATLAVVALTAVPGPWFADVFANSVERSGPVGVLLVGGAVAALVSALARLRSQLVGGEEGRAAAEAGEG